MIEIDLVIDEAASIRMAFLMTHYRKPSEMGEKKLKEARQLIRRFHKLATQLQDSLKTRKDHLDG